MISTPQLQQMQAQTLAQQPTPQVDLERKREMRSAWKAYRGDFPDPLKIGKDQLNDNVISNRCAPIVDKGVSALFGPVLKIEATGASIAKTSQKSGAYANNGNVESLDPKGIQEYLDGVWGDDDDRMTLLSLLSTNGGVCGQCFVKLIPAQEEMKYPRLVVLDPQLIRIVTPPDDCNLILAFIIEYPGANDMQCKQIIARVDPDGLSSVEGSYDLDDTWTITNYMRKGTTAGMQNSWQQVGEQEEWSYPFPPIFTNQNLPNPNESWGIPDLTHDLIRQNKILNFVQSNTSRIIKYHAHPKTWGKGIGANQVQLAVDDILLLQSDNAQLANLEMQSDLSSSLNFADVIRANMDEQSRVPAVALGRLADLPKGTISGVALQLLFQPLLEKTTMKRRLYGKLIREISRAVLVLAGLIDVSEYEDFQVDLHWETFMPNDDLQAAQTSIIYQQLGVSEQTVLQRLGFDPDDEAAKNEESDQRKLVAASRGQGLPPTPPNQQQAPDQANGQAQAAMPNMANMQQGGTRQ